MFTRLENGAEVEMEVVTYVESGAEKEADAVFAVKNGAEEEVWSNIIYMNVTYDTVSGESFRVYKDSVTLSAPFSTGYLRVTADGTFVNPTITYSYSGGMYYYDDTGSYDKVAGRIRAFAETANGDKTRGTRYNIGSTSGFTSGTVTETFTGTFKTIGIEFYSIKCGLSEFSGNSFMTCSSIRVDGKKYAVDPADAR